MRSPVARARRSAELAVLAFAAFGRTALPAAPPPGPASPAGEEAGAPAPSLADSLRPGAVVSSPLGMVVSSTPEASWAGARMLEAGGNAVDAAVAAAFAQTSADPGGSGVGGQTWMVIRLASGVERAVFCPSRAPQLFDRARMKAAREGPDLWGPMAAGVPTTVATLAHALERYGTMSFAEVLVPAIEAAESGYRTQPLERDFLGDYTRRLFDSDVLYPVYLTGPTGESGIPDPGPAGTCVKIPMLAETLRRLAEAGAADFYTGTIASKLDEEMTAAGGFVRRSDLARVPASVRDVVPVRGSYRGRTVLSVPHPAGGRVVVMALQILDALPPATLAEPGLGRGHAIVEAVRIARSAAAAVTRQRRDDVTEGPLLSEWLTKEWAAGQAARIRPESAIPPAELGGDHFSSPGDRGTTQISVVDAKGNAVSLTQSLGRYFGAAWAAPGLGFPLNAFLEPYDSNDPASSSYLRPAAIATVPVAPVLVVRDGQTVLVAGARGSSRIPSMLLNFLAGLVDGAEPPADACARPRVLWEDDNAGPRVMLEMAPPLTPDDLPALARMGYGNVYALTVPDRNLTAFGGINAVVRDPASSAWLGIVDGRVGGTAAAPSRIAPRAR